MKFIKHRITKQDNRYYPEYKFLFFWWSRYTHPDDLYFDDWHFSLLQNAKNFLKNHTKRIIAWEE